MTSEETFSSDSEIWILKLKKYQKLEIVQIPKLSTATRII
jgi:hypothetical protein